MKDGELILSDLLLHRVDATDGGRERKWRRLREFKMLA
jgi:hypothetical protein